jgi:hypothetical protein
MAPRARNQGNGHCLSAPISSREHPLHMDTTRSEPTRLNVVTFPQQTTQPAQHDCAGDLSLQEGVVATVRGIVTIVPDPCSGSYLCDCPTCVKDRERLAARGARTRVPQPWDTRRAA